MNADNGMPSVPGLAASEFHSCPSCRMLTCRGRVSRAADVTPFGRTTVEDTTHTQGSPVEPLQSGLNATGGLSTLLPNYVVSAEARKLNFV